MTTQYTTKQLKEFADFCKRHDLQFGNRMEHQSALDTYFIYDPLDEKNCGILCEQQRGAL